MDWLDMALKAATGKTNEQLRAEGGKTYPQENQGENQGTHRLASKLMTDRFGPVVSQAAGVANEGLEALSRKATIGEYFPAGVDESVRDLGANLRGAQDSQGWMQAISQLLRK